MSWSVSAIGKPAAVAAKIAGDIEKCNCPEPEQSIKAAIAGVIASALVSYPEGAAVRVEVFGSQWSPAGDGKFVNQLSVKIENVPGFVE